MLTLAATASASFEGSSIWPSWTAVSARQLAVDLGIILELLDHRADQRLDLDALGLDRLDLVDLGAEMGALLAQASSASRDACPRPARAPCRRAASAAAGRWRRRRGRRAPRGRDRPRPGSSCETRKMLLSAAIALSSAATHLSRPTNSGTIMCGKTTMSRSGRTGRDGSCKLHRPGQGTRAPDTYMGPKAGRINEAAFTQSRKPCFAIDRVRGGGSRDFRLRIGEFPRCFVLCFWPRRWCSRRSRPRLPRRMPRPARSNPAPASNASSATENRRRGGSVLGGIARGALGRFGGGAAANIIAPMGSMLGDAIMSLLDCDEQRQAATATEQATERAERGGVGTSASWRSETRPGVDRLVDRHRGRGQRPRRRVRDRHRYRHRRRRGDPRAQADVPPPAEQPLCPGLEKA